MRALRLRRLLAAFASGAWLFLLAGPAPALGDSTGPPADGEPGASPTPDADRRAPPARVDVLVTGEPAPSFERSRIRPEQSRGAEPDAAALLRGTPGANVNSNGPVSGQVQYRGMFGPRMNVRVDGMAIAPGGPNWMDPPLHYVPRAQLEELELERGIASVGDGIESFGGTVRARSKQGRFAESDAFEIHGDLEGAYRSVDDGYSFGGVAWVANRRHRLHVVGSTEGGDDRDFGSGTVDASEHERHSGGGGYAFRFGEEERQEVFVDYRHDETRASGNPGLPMDIEFLDTEIVRTGFEGGLGPVDLAGKVYYTDVDHEMSNFELRPAPDFNPLQPGPDRRFVAAESSALGFDATASVPVGPGTLDLGIDGHFARFDMDVFDPDREAFFVNQLDGTRRDRYGVFGQWRGDLTPDWWLEVGLRYRRVDMEAGRVDATPARRLPPPGRLRDAFNAADRSQRDDNVDWVLKLRRRLGTHLRLEAAAARKTRSPSHLARYLWLPLEVSAGLADGNNYVGDPDLDPEVSRGVELGLEWQSERVTFTPRVFYRVVDDSIQGVPATDPDVIAVSTGNGDPTPLRFANVDAELFGADGELIVRLADRWIARATASFVDAERRDIDDDLFRIAPLNGSVALTHQRDRWSVTVQGVFADRQDDVSETNGETETAGYALLHLFGRYRFDTGTELAVGVENVLDKTYRDHLAGFNRVAQSDVEVGRRIPGPGRNVYVRLRQTW